MAHKFLDRTSESTSATGTGNFEFAGAEQNCFAFQAGLSNGDTTDYFAIGASGEHEFGKLTYVSSGDEGARTTVRGGSNGTSPVNFTQAPKVTATINAASLKGQWEEKSRATASNSATIDFTLPPGYDEYLVLMWDVTLSAGSNYLGLRTSSNGGSSYDSGGSDYKDLVQDLGASLVGAADNTSFVYLVYQFLSTTPTTPLVGEIKIWRPSAAARVLITASNTYGTSTAIRSTRSQGYRDTAADVDAIRIFPTSSGNIATGTFILLARRNW